MPYFPLAALVVAAALSWGYPAQPLPQGWLDVVEAILWWTAVACLGVSVLVLVLALIKSST